VLKTAGWLLYNFNKVVVNMNRIRDLRSARGMQQADLAKELSVSRVSISRYETGERDPDIETILRLCDIFGCTSDYLLGRSPVPSPDLDPQEEAMILAWRRATPEIRAIIDTALGPYREDVLGIASAPTA